MNVDPATDRTRAQLAGRTGLVAFLIVQAIVGYEWLMSGATKLWRGGFAAGLASELRDKSHGVSGWYRNVLDDAIIPNARLVGWCVLVAEIFVGIALIAGAVVWIARGDRLGKLGWQVLLVSMGLASLFAIVMAVNFHLANASSHPWVIAKSGFDEGIDLDSILPGIQFVMVCVVGRLLLAELRSRRAADADADAASTGTRPEEAARTP